MTDTVTIPANDPRATQLVHSLKTNPEFWEPIALGLKTFEIRKNDRGFQKGDMLLLLYHDPEEGTDYEKNIQAQVTYVLNGWGLEPGYVCMGIKVTKVNRPV